MASVLAGFRGLPQGLFLFIVPVLVYVLMNHPDYQSVADSVTSSLEKLSTDTLRSQMRAPFVLSQILPVGFLGAFAALMLAAFISTHDTYLHSWGSIFIQDVIMPFQDKPFDKDTHLKVLRYSIFGVAVFIFLFSLLFSQSQKIALYFAVTAAIFSGGCGAVIIGGLYWDRGTTAAAWTAMIVGAVIGVGGTLVKQVSGDWLADPSSFATIKSIILFLQDINGQEYWGIGMAASSLSYVSVSLAGSGTRVNMDRLLNRGKYSIKGEMKVVNQEPEIGWKIFGMGKEFTKTDKLIYIVNYAWTGMWTIVFIVGTIYNLSNPVSNSSWMAYWKYYIYINIVVCAVIIVWFTLGGFSDLRQMIKSLPEKLKKIPVMWGGVFATFAPHLIMRDNVGDYVCIGEGDDAIVKLCKSLSENEKPEKIHNFWIRKNGNILIGAVRHVCRAGKKQRWKESQGWRVRG